MPIDVTRYKRKASFLKYVFSLTLEFECENKYEELVLISFMINRFAYFLNLKSISVKINFHGQYSAATVTGECVFLMIKEIPIPEEVTNKNCFSTVGLAW